MTTFTIHLSNIDWKHRITHSEDTPDGLTLYGDQICANYRSSGIALLPNRLTVCGDFRIPFSTYNPLRAVNELTVTGELDLYCVSIETLPPKLDVGGGLDIRNTDIFVLPTDIRVGGDILTTHIMETPVNNNAIGGKILVC